MKECIYEYHIFEMWKYELDRKKVIAVIDTTFAVVRESLKKKWEGCSQDFSLGVGPNTVFRISVNVIWESTHSPWGMSHLGGGGGGYFPKLPKRVVLPNRIMTLELFRLL